MDHFASSYAMGRHAPVPPPTAEAFSWNPDTLDWEALPAGLQELHALVGAAPTILLAEAFGGTSVYVPCRPHSDHPLVACIGMAAALLLATTYGGEKLHIPKVDAIERQVRSAQLRQLREQGMSITLLAREFNLTPRRVRQILAA